MKVECIETRYHRDKQYNITFECDRDIFKTTGIIYIHPEILEWYRETFGKDVDVEATGRGSCPEYELRTWTTWTLSENEYAMFLLKFKELDTILTTCYIWVNRKKRIGEYNVNMSINRRKSIHCNA